MMEIQDVGLPGWSLQLPHGMTLKMNSPQGVLLIPDEEPESQDPEFGLLMTTLNRVRKQRDHLLGLLGQVRDLGARLPEDLAREIRVAVAVESEGDLPDKG